MPAKLRRLPIPPHSVEAEQSVLGSLLISNLSWPRIVGKIGAADFYRQDHKTIFAAIANLQGERRAVDVVTVSEYLERRGTLDGAGGLGYLGRLASETPTAENIEEYARVVRERSSLRSIKAIAETMLAAATDLHGSMAVEIAAHAQEQLQRLHSRARTGKGLVDARQLVNDLTDELDARSAGPSGLRVGLAGFDDLTCGLEAGDLVVIAGRPGMGKTALLGSIGSSVSDTSGVAIFSAEMASRQLIRRLVAMHSEIPQGLLRTAEKLTDKDWSKIAKASSAIATHRMWIDDTPAPTLMHLRTECMAHKSRGLLGLIMIDYVQLVRGMGASRYEQLREVAYGLKALAKELMVPVLALAQLNREVESRENKRPAISDLRDSGAIEEAADIVALLYSEGYYNTDFEMPYVLEANVAKNRNGERGQCLWRLEGAFSRITDLEPGPAAEYRRLLNKRQKRCGNNL